MIKIVSTFSTIYLATFLVFFLHPASAEEYSSAPILRIESVAHTAPIRAISADAAGKIVVTASEDKTARVWELPSGRLLRVLRPPIGIGNEGSLYAAAMTPDSQIIAVGGWSKTNDVYLFSRASGQLIHRITGLPNVITHLAFSPDGKALVVNLWGKNGVRLFTSDDHWQHSREALGDSDYLGESYGANFSANGKLLVTTSFDGMIRLYNVTELGIQLRKSARASSGAQPYNAIFSPDQSSIALSYSDTVAVQVIQSADLQLAYTPDLSGVISNGKNNLSALSWSADGQHLYAAGSWKLANGGHGMRHWTMAGRGTFIDSTLASNTITSLRPLPDGRILFAASDPLWGAIDSVDRVTKLSTAGLADYRGHDKAFTLARDGNGVGFTYAQDKSIVASFDVAGMAYTAGGANWNPAETSVKGVMLERWFESARPMVNQRSLRLETNEMAMSVAISANKANFALGSNFTIRYFNRSGTELWRTSAPGTTWHVNLSQDGRWLVAGFSDGTIRWYRSKDGAEQLAFLPHADGKRWVVWTPFGYYAASVGGEDLIGWHINRGAQQAGDFYPASRLRSTFFRPDVIALVLEKADGEMALQAADQLRRTSKPGNATLVSRNDIKEEKVNAIPTAQKSVLVKKSVAKLEQHLPPIVTILSPLDGGSIATRELNITISVRAPADAPITSLRVRVNGQIVDIPESRSIPVASAIEAGEAQHQLRITLPAQDAELMVFAENQFGFSTPAVLRLRWTGSDQDSKSKLGTASTSGKIYSAKTTSGEPDTRPTLYVLAVGVSKYNNPSIRLDFAAKDASDFAASLKKQQDGLYRKVVIKLLTDEHAKRDDVLDGLEWIRREMTNRDVGMVYLAGHGVNDSDGVFYYLPQDIDVDKLKRTGVIFTEIKNTLATLPGKALFFVDTCHAGNVLGTGRRAIPNDITAVINELTSAENGVIVFAAATGRQFAQESAAWHNGVFTMSLIEGLGGKADNARTGRVTHKMLDLYTSERVKELTKGAQSPVTIVPQGLPDFPLSIVR